MTEVKKATPKAAKPTLKKSESITFSQPLIAIKSYHYTFFMSKFANNFPKKNKICYNAYTYLGQTWFRLYILGYDCKW